VFIAGIIRATTMKIEAEKQPKRRYTSKRQHGEIYQKAVSFKEIKNYTMTNF
jgi:hypothetical protein